MGVWMATTKQINYVLNAVRIIVSREYRNTVNHNIDPAVTVVVDDKNRSTVKIDESSTSKDYQLIGDLMAKESESVIGKLPYDPYSFKYRPIDLDERELKTAVVLSVEMKNRAIIYVEKDFSITEQICNKLIEDWILTDPNMNDNEHLLMIKEGDMIDWLESRRSRMRDIE